MNTVVPKSLTRSGTGDGLVDVFALHATAGSGFDEFRARALEAIVEQRL
jgi:thiamine phosphate synthase YjbQ (UPF0047 family)